MNRFASIRMIPSKARPGRAGITMTIAECADAIGVTPGWLRSRMSGKYSRSDKPAPVAKQWDGKQTYRLEEVRAYVRRITEGVPC